MLRRARAVLTPEPGRSRSLREAPLLMLSGVAAFVIWAVVLATVLLRRDNGPSLAQAPMPATATVTPTNLPTLTATAAATMAAPTAVIAAVSPSPASATEVTAATVVAAGETAPTATAPADAALPSPSTTSVETPLLALLPTLGNLLPEGFVVTQEGRLSAEQVAAVYRDPAAQRARLAEWGFRDAAQRQFELPSPTPEQAANATTRYAALVVEFDTPDGARQALEASQTEALAAAGAQVADAPAPPLGDASRAASGTLTVEGETLRVAYVLVQAGSRVFSFAGGSPGADPLADVVRVAKATLNGQ